MPPKDDLIRVLVVFGVSVGGGLVFMMVSPWPWFVAGPISLTYLAAVAEWYRRRYGDRWPLYGHSWWEHAQTWPTWNPWVLGGLGGLIGILAALLMILIESIAWSGWE